MEIARSRILVVMLLFVYAFLVLLMSEIFTFSEESTNETNENEKQRTYTVSHIMNKRHQIKAINRVAEDNQAERLFITHL